MKKMIIIVLILSSLLIKAQEKERHSRAYIGLLLHDNDQPGISLVNSFGINKYVGLGAGVDFTKFKRSIIAPAYVDLRIKYPMKAFAPYILGQFGKPVYSRTEGTGIYTTNVNGGNRREIMITRTGNILYGGGIGISHKVGKVGWYLSYIRRCYKINNATKDINGKEVKYSDNETIEVFNAGLVF